MDEAKNPLNSWILRFAQNDEVVQNLAMTGEIPANRALKCKRHDYFFVIAFGGFIGFAQFPAKSLVA